jgi:hypothetical protein
MRTPIQIRLLFGLFTLFIAISCQRASSSAIQTPEQARRDALRTANFPKTLERAETLPEKENFWIFLLAGQSNMAGRGQVAPEDTIAHPRILSLDRNNKWVYAKEPLHYYEPELTGLDCGLSFARTLLEAVPDNVSIGLLPCAVGGSSVGQWNDDVKHRGVKLFSNFKKKAAMGASVGTIKGILWHQGESDTNPALLMLYREGLTHLFKRFREVTHNEHLPIIMGEIGSFSEPAEVNARWDSLNTIINTFAAETKGIYHIDTEDLTSKADHIHFDAVSQRLMGQRFAEKFIESTAITKK